jgi:hypothetical protein
MHRPLFASLFDTARVQARERAAAQTLLILTALSASPSELATIHAINSKLLLHDCAGSDDFLHLVRLGRIRFRILPDGKGPREELARRFGFERYLGAWPEIYEKSTSLRGKLIVEYTRPAQEFLLNREPLRGLSPVTGNQSLDHRLHRARLFFEAIEAAHESISPNREKVRQGEFERLVARIPDAATRQGEDQGLLSLFKTVLRDETSSRAKLYEKIDTTPMDHMHEDDAVVLRERAKSWINRANDSAMAHSLNSRLLGCDSEAPLAPELQQSGLTRPAEIRARHLSGDQVRAFAEYKIEWKHVRTAVEPAQARDGEMEDAFSRLTSILGAFDLKDSQLKAGTAVLSALAAAAAVVVAPDAGASGFLVELQGALGGHSVLFGAVSAALAILSTSADMKFIQHRVNAFVVEQKAARARSKLETMRGWLDLE